MAVMWALKRQVSLPLTQLALSSFSCSEGVLESVTLLLEGLSPSLNQVQQQ